VSALRTRLEWAARGLFPKSNAVPILVPFRPGVRQQKFTRKDVAPKVHADLPGGYEPYIRTNFRVNFRQGFGAARNKQERFMDRWRWTPPSKYGMTKDDWDVVAPKRKIIYPPSIFKGRKVGIHQNICIACDKPFQSKRKDAKYCGVACRKWASRKNGRSQINVPFQQIMRGEETCQLGN
jgi:hypothetical protein